MGAAKGAHPSFGMTLTQAIRGLFRLTHPSLAWVFSVPLQHSAQTSDSLRLLMFDPLGLGVNFDPRKV